MAVFPSVGVRVLHHSVSRSWLPRGGAVGELDPGGVQHVHKGGAHHTHVHRVPSAAQVEVHPLGHIHCIAGNTTGRG